MSTASGIPGGGTEKGEVHTETPQPIDLAHGHGHTISHPLHSHATHVLRANSPVAGAASVVQIRPVRTFLGPTGSLVGGKGTTVSLPTVVTATAHPSIFVNRSGPNFTILPRATAGQLGVSSVSGIASGSSANISTLQFTRGTILSNVRPTLTTGGQPTSITVTPISAANFGNSLRLGSPVNNGSWIQTSGTSGTTFGSIRPTTIQVTSRSIRPDGGKIIHIPQGGIPHKHMTQLQVVDKGPILKPTTPISVRGAIHSSQGNTTGITLHPLSPFTIRAANIRSPSSVITTASPTQKVITQPAHGPPIIVNASQKFTQIQNFSSLPRIPVISISAANGGNTVITGSNNPLVGLSTRHSSPNLVMSSGGGSTGQLTKVYPISRDVSTTLVETYINQGHVQVQPQQNHINSPTLTVVTNANAAYGTISSQVRPTFVITSTSNSNSTVLAQGSSTGNYAQSQSLKGITPAHQLVQVHSPISLQSTSGALNLPNYYIEPKNLPTNVSIFPHATFSPQAKRISVVESLEKRGGFAEKGPLVTGIGQMIISSSATDSQIQAGLSAQFAHTVPIQTTHANQITAHPLSLAKGASLSLPNSQISIHQHSIPTNVISSPALITTSVTTTTSSATALTTTNTSIVTLSISSSGGNGGATTAISTITTSTTTSSPTSGSISTTSNSLSSTTTTPIPVQSPSQSKATLSPRPSILRKRMDGRETGFGTCDTNVGPLRAQRNLSVNFSGSTPSMAQNTGGANNNGPSVSSPSVLISTVSNKENNSTTLTVGFPNSIGNFGLNLPPSNISGPPGVSILKKDFQPPNEESSWQSCSSNSSSGSTTISATSETAETQAAEQSLSSFALPPVATVNNPTHHSSLVISRPPPQNTMPLLNMNPIQNGMLVRSRAPQPHVFSGLPSSVSIVSGSHPQPIRHRATSLAKGRETKGRGKDVVSPRKKPRKQQLTTSDFIDSSSPEISFYQAKRFKRNDSGVKAPEKAVILIAPPPEPPQPDRVFYILQKPRASLLETNKFTPNPLNNHFQRYSDVKSKDERRPTISDLANQKGVLNKISGWKLKHLAIQMDKVVESEMEVIQQFNSLLSEINSEDCMTSTSLNRDLSRIEDLLKGNLQRCKVVKDQITESKSQVTKVLEHHPRVLEILNKHITKRPVKKREKL